MNATLVRGGNSHCWLKVLEDSKVCFVGLDPQVDIKLMELLLSVQNWKVESADEEIVFFIRNDMAMGIAKRIDMKTEKEIKKMIFPPTYFLAAILLMAGLKFLLPEMQVFSTGWSLLGLLPIIIGTMANLMADRKFHVAKTTVRPYEESNALLTNGIYRISRNPMYLGMTLVLVGIMLLLNNLYLLGIIIGFIYIISTKFIHVEEKMLAAKFGEDWLQYRVKTRRWI